MQTTECVGTSLEKFFSKEIFVLQIVIIFFLKNCAKITLWQKMKTQKIIKKKKVD